MGFDTLIPLINNNLSLNQVSLHGYLAFSESPISPPTYPLEFPISRYPAEADPSFIGPFYSKCKIGELAGDEFDARRSGVYFR